VMTAEAYLNHGRWVADCPASGCTDARAVYPEDANGVPSPSPILDQACKRGHQFRIVMPPPQLEAQIVAAVDDREVDADKSWFPKGHQWAELGGFPTGQSPKELVAEGKHVREHRGAQAAARRDRARQALADLGIEVRPDGTFSGSL
jgi:hypothetical protein